MKKIVTAVLASAFALALAVPVATACPGHDGSKVVNKEKKEDGKVVKEDKAQDKDKAKTKETTKKKPVKVSSK